MFIKNQITEKLTKAFDPVHLEVVNESYKHSVPQGAESHFKVIIVSESFSGMKRIDRQREVNKILSEELNGLIHALAQKAMTPSEWESSPDFVTPNCKGGSK